MRKKNRRKRKKRSHKRNRTKQASLPKGGWPVFMVREPLVVVFTPTFTSASRLAGKQPDAAFVETVAIWIVVESHRIAL